jgi:hypothetical protein
MACSSWTVHDGSSRDWRGQLLQTREDRNGAGLPLLDEIGADEQFVWDEIIKQNKL